MTERSPKQDETLSRQVAGAMFWNVALFPLKFVVVLAAGIIVPNLLGVERFALYTLITAVAATIGTYADLGMERALPRYIPEVAHRFGARGLRRFLGEVIGVKLGLLLVLVLVFNLISAPLLGYMRNREADARAGLEADLQAAHARLEQLSDPQEIAALEQEIAELEREVAGHDAVIQRLDQEGRLYLLTISAMLVLGALFDVLMRLLLSYFRQRATNTIEVVVAIVQPLLIIGLVLLGLDVKGVLIALVVTPILGVILAAWRVRHAVRRLEEETAETYRRPKQVWPRFLTFSGISYVMGLTTWMYDLPSLSLVVAAYLSTADVAALGVASNFVRTFLTYLVVPLSGINVPLFAHLHARQARERVQEAFSVLTQFLLLLLVPTGCGLALLAPSLMPLLYAKFPPETVALVLVFLLAMFLESIIGTVQPMLLVHERYGILLVARLSALVVVPLLFVLVPPYGLVGAAVAAGVARLLSRGITLFYGLRYFPLRFPLRFTGRVVAGAAVMSGVLYPLARWWGIAQIGAGWGGKLATLGKDVALALLGAVIFWAVLKALGGLEPEGKKRLQELRFPFKEVLLRLL